MLGRAKLKDLKKRVILVNQFFCESIDSGESDESGDSGESGDFGESGDSCDSGESRKGVRR